MFLSENDGFIALGICLAAAVVIIIVLVIVLAMKMKTPIDPHDEKIVVKDGVRYNADGDKVADIRFTVGDILLAQQEKYVVSKKGPVLPGKYHMVGAHENMEKFNVRIGGFVREYYKNDEIVLSEGDEICATSCNVILK